MIRQRRPGVVPREGCEVVLHDERPHARIFAAEAVEPALVRDQELRLRHADAVRDLVALPPTVQADRDRAEARDGPEAGDPLGAVRAEERDAVAGADVETFAQRPGYRGGVAAVLGEGRAAAVVEDVVVERVKALRLGQQLAEAPRPVAKHGHGFAAHRFDGDFEHSARPGEPGVGLGEA